MSEHPIFAPSYYADFHCIADKCRHSCCIGWEIDIDEESYVRYQHVPGKIGEKLRHVISGSYDTVSGEDDDASFVETPHLELQGENERCPFLTDRNLCELILTLGEGSLCQICRDHPRFRNFIGDREEIGPGLCCEEAARLILSQTEPFRLLEMTDFSGETASEIDPASRDFLLFRSRLFDIIADRSLPFKDRIGIMFEAIGLPYSPIGLSHWSTLLADLERLDPSWDEEIALLSGNTGIDYSEALDTIVSENLLSYFLFRHLAPALDDGLYGPRVVLPILLTLLLCALGESHRLKEGELTFETQVELARMLSSEIEYSDENITRLLEEIERLYF
ncbi:MAG: flagellin lysine-N-methylase [Clostridiales bacterium]|nr:flagellin lysine-N-methylase [Clostridiales bacterium]